MMSGHPMQLSNVPVPLLTTAYKGPLNYIEKVILANMHLIESWFRDQWQKTPASITSSVDLRNAAYKLAPVDTNLFPAGFNNLNRAFLPLCVQAMQSVIGGIMPTCTKILTIPESHTRNQYYLQSLNMLRTILLNAGFMVRIGSLDPTVLAPVEINVANESYLIEPLRRLGSRVGLDDFDPCFLLLNNDLSLGIPEILSGIEQAIYPTEKIGWSSRLKSSHFQFFNAVSSEFAQLVQIDPWLINPLFAAVDSLDFMTQTGLESLADVIDEMLVKLRQYYAKYEITDRPFIAIKADNGTYGMGVMMVHSGQDVLTLNRRARTNMSGSKGGRRVSRVIVQEGIYSCERMLTGAVAEPVVYMIGQFVVGGFYRVHNDMGNGDNLNSPGMHFEPLAFADVCNMPCANFNHMSYTNRFYVYGVIARLAALAAAREIAALGSKV